MSDSGVGPERVVGKRAPVSLKQQRILVVTAALYTAFVAWQVSQGRWTSTGAFIVWVVWVGVIFLRPATVADREGIRRPWRRRRFVPWSEVDEVLAPQIGTHPVRLRLTSGKTLALDDIAATASAEVARIGGVRVAAPEKYRPPPARPRQPTDRDVEADVNRRAQALAERGAQLDAEYRRIQGRNRPPGDPGTTAAS